MVVHGKYHPYYRLLNYFHLKSKLHDEKLDREGSIISYVSLVKTIETGIVLLLRMALHSFFSRVHAFTAYASQSVVMSLFVNLWHFITTNCSVVYCHV